MEAVASPKVRVHPAPRSGALAMPWYIYGAVLAAASILIGLIWDISWHMSIGRDSQFSPPHLLIYFGGLLGGLGGGYQMFFYTFSKNPVINARTVGFWGFRAPLGALFAVWGALAMATSAPMDDWWHNAYGLDVKILSPPHALLALGLITLIIGSMLTLLSYQNRVSALYQDEQVVRRVHNLLPIVAGVLYGMFSILFWENMQANDMHNPYFYQIACAIWPLFMIAMASASRLKWPITRGVLWYMAFIALTNWILQLFPASPKLGPIHNPVDRYVPMDFPLLFLFPALCMDVLQQRMVDMGRWKTALVLGLTFYGVFILFQWFFAYFLLSEAADNWFFYSYSVPYNANPNWQGWSSFSPWRGSEISYFRGFFLAGIFAVLSARLGISWGLWMKQLQR